MSESWLMAYCSEVEECEENLFLLSALLVNSKYLLEAQDVRRLGDSLRRHLDKKLILDHFFLGRSLNFCRLSEAEIQILLKGFRVKYGNKCDKPRV